MKRLLHRLLNLLVALINATGIRRHIAYGRYVLRHKWFVYQEGRKLGLPRLMLILHDWDKFMPDEWFPYARTFYAKDGSKRYNENTAFTTAWAKHQWRNKHHWQWWMRCAGGKPLKAYRAMVMDRGTGFQWSNWIEEWVDFPLGWHDYNETLPMTDLYRREMLADWRGASRAIMGYDNTPVWYLSNQNYMVLHPETRAWIEAELGLGA